MNKEKVIYKHIEVNNGSFSRILAQEHTDGVWLEIGSEDWAILDENQLDDLINVLMDIKNKRKESEISDMKESNWIEALKNRVQETDWKFLVDDCGAAGNFYSIGKEFKNKQGNTAYVEIHNGLYGSSTLSLLNFGEKDFGLLMDKETFLTREDAPNEVLFFEYDSTTKVINSNDKYCNYYFDKNQIEEIRKRFEENIKILVEHNFFS